MSLASQILECLDLAEEVVDVPEWKCSIKLRALTCEQLDRARKAARGIGPNAEVSGLKLNALVLIEAAHDPTDDSLVFDRAHVDGLMKKNVAVLERLAEKILSISGIGKNAEAEAEKNS